MDYIEAFRSLKTNNKYSRKSPHKAVLLLTVLEMFEKNIIQANEIKYDDQLKRVFLEVWNRVLPNETLFFPEAFFPFWYLQSEEFWHIVPNRGKEDILTLLKDNNAKPSESKLTECVKYAELDEDLYFLMTIPSGRSSLKRVLLENYTDLLSPDIEKLSAVVDNTMDHSLSAISHYQSIIASPVMSSKAQMYEADEQVKNKFFSLSEELQLSLNIEYYTFLKNHKFERELFLEICPSVYDLYDRIVYHHVRQEDIAPSFSFTYENFLCDLKISLMSEDGSMSLIDSISGAIDSLRGLIDNVDNIITEDNIIDEDSLIDVNTPKENPIVNNVIYEPIIESRRGLSWTKEEEEKLKTYFDRGYSYSDIATLLGRTEIAIKMRLSLLGIIDYTYEPDKEATAESTSELSVKNTADGCSLYYQGRKIYSDKGLLKVINGKPYRFNYKSMCLTVKGMDKEGDVWVKGGKLLVAYSQSDLYKLVKSSAFLEYIEDFVECQNIRDNKMKFDGVWYDFDGNKIIDDCVTIGEPVISIHNSDYTPKGQLKSIDAFVQTSFDYLWLISIVDFMNDKNHSTSISFDELGCRMISNAWTIINKSPETKLYESSIVRCIEYLIEESKEYMDIVLDWNSTKEDVYSAIKDYPMGGDFEDTVDELVKDAPYNIIKAWIKKDKRQDIIIDSMNFSNACLYSIHNRKIDPYIEINPKWLGSLYSDNVLLLDYLIKHYLDFINQQS